MKVSLPPTSMPAPVLAAPPSRRRPTSMLGVSGSRPPPRVWPCGCSSCKRALKPNGALVLHGDATADAYLRILLDAIFGASNFQMTEPTQCHGSHLPRSNVGLNADRSG